MNEIETFLQFLNLGFKEQFNDYYYYELFN